MLSALRSLKRLSLSYTSSMDPAVRCQSSLHLLPQPLPSTTLRAIDTRVCRELTLGSGRNVPSSRTPPRSCRSRWCGFRSRVPQTATPHTPSSGSTGPSAASLSRPRPSRSTSRRAGGASGAWDSWSCAPLRSGALASWSRLRAGRGWSRRWRGSCCWTTLASKSSRRCRSTLSGTTPRTGAPTTTSAAYTSTSTSRCPLARSWGALGWSGATSGRWRAGAGPSRTGTGATAPSRISPSTSRPARAPPPATATSTDSSSSPLARTPSSGPTWSGSQPASRGGI
eukprot:132187-Rhodomonas_salina.2